MVRPRACVCGHLPVTSRCSATGIVATKTLIKNKLKFCGMINSLGEKSFLEDKDLTRRESMARKKDAKDPRKFGTADNKVAKGIKRYEGGEEKARQDREAKDASLKLTTSRTTSRKGKGKGRAATPAAMVRTLRLFASLAAPLTSKKRRQEWQEGRALSLIRHRRCLTKDCPDCAQENDDVEAGERGAL